MKNLIDTFILIINLPLLLLLLAITGLLMAVSLACDWLVMLLFDLSQNWVDRLDQMAQEVKEERRA